VTADDVKKNGRTKRGKIGFFVFYFSFLVCFYRQSLPQAGTKIFAADER